MKSAGKGYAGNILYVDLTTGAIEKRPLADELVDNFLGGMGIDARLAYDIIPPKADALSPRNAILIGVPPFVGTLIAGAGRCNVSGKSPLTGTVGYSSAACLAMLKFAGYDHLVITGRADRPVYLEVFNDDVKIIDAAGLWGKDVMESTDLLWQRHGADYDVATIGPAGENMVRFASVAGNKAGFFGRGGFGAIMGSKNLKAIVAWGTNGIKAANRNRLVKLNQEFLEQMKADPAFGGWRALGTLVGLGQFVREGVMACRNSQQVPYEGLRDLFSHSTFLNRMKVGSVSCLACPIGCKHAITMKGGKYDGMSVSLSCILSLIISFGTQSFVKDYDELIACAELCERLGLDIYSTGGVLAFAFEMFERGLITGDDTQGLELEWGSPEVVKELITRVAHRDGFGDMLAEGVAGAAARVGKGAERYAIHVKGMDTIYEPRGKLCPESFSQYTNLKGGMSGLQSITLGKVSREDLDTHLKTLGVPEEARRRALEEAEGYSIPRVTRWYEDYHAVVDSLGLCARSIFQIFSLDKIAELYTALTGREKSAAELMKAGDRIRNIQKAFNVREGFSREADRGPARFATEPLKVGEQEHSPLGWGLIDEMLNTYYEERGWERQSGVPTKEKLAELGLADLTMKR